MKITITRQELLELWHGLPALANLTGFKLGYAVARTKAKLRPEVEALDEALKPDKDFQKYEEKRLILCQKYVQKDAQGNPAVQNGQFIFGENREVFEKEMAPLSEEYAQAIEDRKTQFEDYQDSLRDPITVEVHQITEADVPEDASVAQVEALYRLIKAEE
jgi:hypothetical protein